MVVVVVVVVVVVFEVLVAVVVVFGLSSESEVATRPCCGREFCSNYVCLVRLSRFGVFLSGMWFRILIGCLIAICVVFCGPVS